MFHFHVWLPKGYIYIYTLIVCIYIYIFSILSPILKKKSVPLNPHFQGFFSSWISLDLFILLTAVLRRPNDVAMSRWPSLTCILCDFTSHMSPIPRFWVNYNISPTWIKAIWGWFPLLTMIIVRSQWGRYNLPSQMFSNWISPTWRIIPRIVSGVSWPLVILPPRFLWLIPSFFRVKRHAMFTIPQSSP